MNCEIPLPESSGKIPENESIPSCSYSRSGWINRKQTCCSDVKKRFENYLNSSRTSNIDHSVNQKLNNHKNFRGINNCMCDSYKLASLTHILVLNPAAGVDENFYVTYPRFFWHGIYLIYDPHMIKPQKGNLYTRAKPQQ